MDAFRRIGSLSIERPQSGRYPPVRIWQIASSVKSSLMRGMQPLTRRHSTSAVPTISLKVTCL